jgi:hypothetical protein
MANLSDFLPAAGGSGGFTKMLKYSTARALDDADYNNAASYTVNPATDLGLEDGASIGYFMVGSGGASGNSEYGAYGGKILMGTAIITTASTNLVLTPGVSAQSTISGGLTLTTGDGSNHYGHRGLTSSSKAISGGIGINGYGAGCIGWGLDNGQYNPVHGFGQAVSNHSTMTASDGAILLFY